MLKYLICRTNITPSKTTMQSNVMSITGGGGGGGLSLIFLNNVFPGEYLRPVQHPGFRVWIKWCTV
jgi:hypothetical protein